VISWCPDAAIQDRVRSPRSWLRRPSRDCAKAIHRRHRDGTELPAGVLRIVSVSCLCGHGFKRDGCRIFKANYGEMTVAIFARNTFISKPARCWRQISCHQQTLLANISSIDYRSAPRVLCIVVAFVTISHSAALCIADAEGKGEREIRLLRASVLVAGQVMGSSYSLA
jgi:hypothetical protein